MRRSSGAGISCATGLLPSANFSPGEPGSKPRAARGRRRPTVRRTTRCSWALALAQAQSWLAKRTEDLPEVDRDFIDLSSQGRRGGGDGEGGRSWACWSFHVIAWPHRWFVALDGASICIMGRCLPMLRDVSAVRAHRGGRAGVEAGQFVQGMCRAAPRWSSCRRVAS